MVNYEDNLTPLGRQMKAEREAQAAQANHAMMGVPQGGTGGGGPQYKFNMNDVLSYRDAPNSDDAGRWFRIKGADGQPLVVERQYGPATWQGEGEQRQYTAGPVTGYNVLSDPGDFGGGWLTDGPEAAKMNGRAYDSYDASGKYAGSNKVTNWTDSGVMGPWGALAVLAMPFAAAAMGVGAGAAGAAGGATAAGSAGAAEAASAAAAASELGAGAAALPTFGVVDAGAFAPAAAAGSTGTGLTLGGGGLGLTGSAGPGLSLAGGGGAGLTAASPGAAAIGGGLGTTGVVAGTGSLLSPSVLSGVGAAASALGGAPSTAGVPPPPNPNLTTPGISGSSLIPGIPDNLLTSLLGPAIGGALSANASKSAADAQLTATREAAALQEPFRQGGLKGLNRLLDLYGLSENTTAEGYGSAQKKFGMSDFQADPGYQFRQAEGEKGMQRAASAAGTLGSGKFLKDAMRFNQGIASDEYGKAYDRYGTDIARQINPLQALAGQGQSAANTIGEYTTQGGNATAAGKVGTANAVNNAITQGYSMYNNNQWMNRLAPLTQQGVSNPYVS